MFTLYRNEILFSVIFILALILIRLILQRFIVKRVLKNKFDANRRKVVAKFSNITLFILLIIGLVAVWGLDPGEVVIFVSSIVTVLGVAFFAQWSLLSNLTGGVILFFNSTIRIGDHITILDSDFNISGRVDDIGSLYLKLKTDEGHVVFVPNNILLLKPIQHDN